MKNDDDLDKSVLAGPVIGYLAEAIALFILMMA